MVPIVGVRPDSNDIYFVALDSTGGIMSWVRWRLNWAILCAVLIMAGCTASQDSKSALLPPLPSVDLGPLLPAVRSEMEKAFQAAHAAPKDAGANGVLGMLLHAHDRRDAATVCYQRAHLLKPDAYQWPYLLGTIHAAAGRNDEAIVSFRKALLLQPSYVPGQIALADVLFSAGNQDESLRIYQKIVETHPGEARAHYGMGRIFGARNETAKAVGSYQKACELSPAYATAHYALALACRRLGETGRAERHFALYKKHSSDPAPHPDPLLAQVFALNAGALRHIAEAQKFAAEGKVQEAVQAHLRALELDPKLQQAHVNLISLYGRLGRPEEALLHYQHAVKINPSSEEAHYNFAVLMSSEGRFREARGAYEKVLQINPAQADAHNNLGYLFLQNGRAQEALKHFEEALRHRPAFPRAHFNTGSVYLTRRQYSDAIRHFEAALTPEDENTPRYLHALATAYARTGRRDEALIQARRARAAAASRGQTDLAAGIDRDIRTLERSR